MRISNRIKRIVAAGILFGGLTVAGCESKNATSGTPQARMPEVAVVTTRPQQVVLTAELPGRTSAYRVAEIRPQVNGLIQKRLFTEGSDVKAGQALYQIDPAPFQAAFDYAAANLTAMKKNADRARAALGASIAEAAIQQAKAALETVRINLGYTKITAPISGRIGKSSVTDGAIVTAYQPIALATIQQMDPIYVDVPQSTTELLRLKRSLKDGRLNHEGSDQKKVNLLLEDGTAYPLEGTLQFRDVTVEPSTGSVILRLVIPNPEGVLLPGMFVRAVVKEGVSEQAILIPQQAVSRDPKGNPLVLIVDAQGKVQQRMLVLDRAMGDKWLVSSGLAPGDRLIVEGLQKVRPGASVKEVPFDAGSEKPSGERRNAARSAEKSN
jgi:membrane fusion protein (multidrug efflux system)